MGINYGLLGGSGPSQTGGVVAALPTVPNSGIQNLASGLLEGAQVNSQLQRNNLLNQQTQQQMDQSAQMFPEQLANAKAVREGNELINSQTRTAIQEHANQIAAFKRSYDEGMETLRAQDTATWAKVQESQASAKNSLAEAAFHLANTKAQESNVYNALASNASDLATMSARAGAERGPEAAQQVWDQGRKMMGTAGEVLPPKFDETTLPTFTGLGLTAKQAILSKQLAKGGSPLDKEIAKTDAGTAGKAGDARRNIVGQLETVKNAKAALEKVPAAYLGPFVGMAGLSKLSPEAATLVSNLNRMTLDMKNQMNMGSQGFTDKDREFVQAIVGDASNYKGSLKQLLDQHETFLNHAAAQNWNTENSIRKKTGDYNQWLADNPPPVVRIASPDGKQMWDVPADKMQEAIKRGGKLQ